MALLPHECLFCHSSLHTSSDICCSCKADLAVNHVACRHCAEPLTHAGICGHCLHRRPVVHAVIAPYLYQPPLDHLLHRFKYHGQAGLSHSLGNLMVEYINNSRVDLPECLIPVPLHRSRQAIRGYNQAHELAALIAAELNIPLDSLSCRRIKNTAAQSSLHKAQRKSNLSGAFQVQLQQDWKHITLVDDVYTTGQTINTLARELIAQGVERVDAWVVARTAEHL